MAIKYVERPFTIRTSNGTSATLTEETGSTNDNRIIVARTVTADNAGNFIGSMGTITGRDVSLQVVTLDRSTETYKADHQDAKEFERTVGDGEASSNSNSNKGGEYGTTSVGEEVLAASSMVARYRVGPPSTRHKSQTYTPSAIVLDLCPYTTHRIVVNSVLFRWMGTLYRDLDGVIYRDWTDTSAGVACGTIDYEAGTVLMNDYVVGGTGPTDFQLLSLWTQASQWTTASLFFNTDAYPLRAGAGGFILSVLDTKGTPLTANVDTQGNITGLHMRGRVDFSRGGVELQFGDFVPVSEVTDAQKAEWWYAAADVGAVEAGKIWRPWPVMPDTLRYSAISYIYLPVDVSLLGLDPAALPSDGRVVFARPGDTAVVGVTHGGSTFVPSLPMTYNIGHQRLSVVQVLDYTGAEIYTGFTADLDAGTVTFTDLSGFPAKPDAGGLYPISVVARTEVYRVIAEVRIDGKVKFTLPIGYEFPVGSVFSTALRFGDRFADVPRTYTQKSWDGVTWMDGVNPTVGEATAKYTGKIVVTNLGAITERWGIKFRSDGINFDLIGQHLGQIASGNINQDFSPINAAAGAPYMTLPAVGWNQGWGVNNTLFIDTDGAEAPIAVIRCTQPGSPAGMDDKFGIEQRGDIGHTPENTFD
ncbi:hypothetical protein G7047_19225 [Diaphorobacter sp. HDW4A]|uniref:hypothetical protein n=1 Tax=Diaphorobacter sp. HDW4A TaxID=2714924 RepID=UPI00140CEAA4|nr:hypothetical protein [Diaphorobacter sp. HDW4A]QIL81810.1 hypothetical protein G7047_19225 [Diaphorobacter sp. HDW4A]